MSSAKDSSQEKQDDDAKMTSLCNPNVAKELHADEKSTHEHHRSPHQRHHAERDDTSEDEDDSNSSSSDEEGAVHHSDGSKDYETKEVILQQISQRLGALSARHRRSVVASPLSVDEDWKPPVHKKSEADERSIRSSVRRNILFANLPEETLEILVNAMKYVSVKPKQVIIEQGDDGDLFYIVDSGLCEVIMDQRVVGEIDGTSERNFFGELALLYDSPRCASVVARTPVECWALDRVTFKRVLMAATIQQRQLYLDFIDQVPILSPLSRYDRMAVADALRAIYYEPNQTILKLGDKGDDFFLIEDGEVKCTNAMGKEVSSRLGSGDFFGELALLNDEVRQAHVLAVRKTKCLVMDRKTFNRLVGPISDHLKRRKSIYELYMQQQQQQQMTKQPSAMDHENTRAESLTREAKRVILDDGSTQIDL